VDTSKLFFALWPDDNSRAEIAGLTSQFQHDYGGRAVPRESLHITLAFLGETPNAALTDLNAIGSGIKTPSFRLTLTRAGSWPGGIFWLAPEESPSPLFGLVSALRDQLKAAHIFFDAKRFVPHMTLLRKARARGVETAIVPMALDFRDFVLVHSLRDEGRVRYEVVGRFPLEISD
jgi:2'-5' RNA ligase